MMRTLALGDRALENGAPGTGALENGALGDRALEGAAVLGPKRTATGVTTV